MNNLLLFIFVLLKINFSFAQWQLTNGPKGGNVNCFIVNGTNTFSGTNNGIWLSIDSGNTWNSINHGLANTNILSFATDGTNIFAGSQGGIFLSTNNGGNWTGVSSGVSLSHIGKTSSKNMKNDFSRSNDTIVYCDRHPSYSKFFKEKGIEFHSFKSSDFVSKQNRNVHNQTLNFFTGKLKDFINKNLRGVSTKHLQGYCNWVSFITNFLKNGTKPIEVVLENKVAFTIYKQREKEYCYLLKNSGRSNYGTYKERYKLSA